VLQLRHKLVQSEDKAGNHAERQFDWTFRGQGDHSQPNRSSDVFFSEALKFFGGKRLSDLEDPWERGAVLAGLVANPRTLLILDGLEPFQEAAGAAPGHLRDIALRAFLLGLTQRNAGLCIITTQETIWDLKSYEEHGGVVRHKLDRLDNKAGIRLLKDLNVVGNDRDIGDAVEAFSGHAMTLSLLGRYIGRATADRNINHWKNLKEIVTDRKYCGPTEQMFEAYEIWFATEYPELLAILRILSLFDGPVSRKCVEEFRESPVIEGLNEPLVAMSNADWNTALLGAFTIRQLKAWKLPENG
jgi:hypothetical protein